MPEANLFLMFTQRLKTLGVAYMVSGSVAVIIYGEPRLTHDVDLIVVLDRGHIARLPEVFPPAEFYCPPAEVIAVEVAREQRGHFNIIHHAFLNLAELPIVLISFSQWSGHTIFVPLESDSEDAHFGVLHLLTLPVFFSQPMFMLLFDVSGHNPARHDIKLESRFGFTDDYKAIEERGVNQTLMLFIHYPSALNCSVDL